MTPSGCLIVQDEHGGRDHRLATEAQQGMTLGAGESIGAGGGFVLGDPFVVMQFVADS